MFNWFLLFNGNDRIILLIVSTLFVIYSLLLSLILLKNRNRKGKFLAFRNKIFQKKFLEARTYFRFRFSQ